MGQEEPIKFQIGVTGWIHILEWIHEYSALVEYISYTLKSSRRL